MSEDVKFVDGLILKKPRDNAPDFVVGSISMKREELITWLGQQEGDWVNADILESKKGGWYAKLNTWTPQEKFQPNVEKSDEPENMPF